MSRMVRRWLIRGVCFLALALMIAAWIMSYRAAFGANFYFAGRFGTIGGVYGLCRVFETPGPRPGFSYFWFEPRTTLTMLSPPPLTLGFGFVSSGVFGPGALCVFFPLWLPTILLAALTWYVWRKTKVLGEGRGFPVELTSLPES